MPMNVKSISTIQAKQVLDATHYLQISNGSGGPVKIFDIEGEVNSTNGTSYFIQLLNTNAPVSTTTVPLYSRLAVLPSATSGLNGFSFIYRPEGLDTANMGNPVGGTYTTDGSNTSSVYVAISSTDSVYTSVAASTQVTVDIEDTYIEIPTQTITGDTSTGVDSLIVYADPGTGHKIIQIVYSNSAASTSVPVYLQMFASAPVANQIPVEGMEWTVTQNALTYIRFGSGFFVQSQGATTVVLGVYTIPNYTLHTGCYLAGSTTAGYYTATTGGNWTMKAWNI